MHNSSFKTIPLFEAIGLAAFGSCSVGIGVIDCAKFRRTAQLITLEVFQRIKFDCAEHRDSLLDLLHETPRFQKIHQWPEAALRVRSVLMHQVPSYPSTDTTLLNPWAAMKATIELISTQGIDWLDYTDDEQPTYALMIIAGMATYGELPLEHKQSIFDTLVGASKSLDIDENNEDNPMALSTALVWLKNAITVQKGLLESPVINGINSKADSTSVIDLSIIARDNEGGSAESVAA